MRSVDSIVPSPENSLIYRPVSTSDPSIKALAEEIREIGLLLEPIVLTANGEIVSGHRRFAACTVLGMTEIPCRVLNVTPCDPDFERVLVAFNNQRRKSIDEVLREIAISTNPQDAYGALLRERETASEVSGEFIVISDRKSRRRISAAKRDLVRAIIKILNDQLSFWPLSDRAVHYGLLNVCPLRNIGKRDSRYRNDPNCYKDVCDILTRMRLEGKIPYSCITDPTRTVVTWKPNREVGSFVTGVLDGLFKGYRRDLQQSQPNHIEIIGEKNTISGSVHPIAMKYCVPYTLGRGYCSLDPRYKLLQRFQKSGKEKLVLLFMNDHDPEGENIPEAFAQSMRDDFGVDGDRLLAKKVCPTQEQARERGLPLTLEMKEKSSRYKKFFAKYGNRGHELEALSSPERSRFLQEAIIEVMDVDAYNREVDAEREDAARLDGLRRKLGPLLRDALVSNDDANPNEE